MCVIPVRKNIYISIPEVLESALLPLVTRWNPLETVHGGAVDQDQTRTWIGKKEIKAKGTTFTECAWKCTD